MAQKSNKIINKQKAELRTKSKISILVPPRIQFWIIFILFIATTLLFFWDQLISKAFFWEDITELWYPFQTFAAREFSKGVIPFWNPYIFSGMPFLADIEVGFFYPFNRLLSLFVDSNGHVAIWFIQFSIIIHFLIAQLAMYSLTRYWKISHIGSIIASVSFAFSLILVCHVIHPMILFHFAWFPFVLMLFIKGIEQRKIKYSILASWFLALSMLAGHPQSTLYESIMLGIVLLWYYVAGVKNKELKGRTNLKFIICGVLPFVISVGMFSIQLLPSRELASLAQRQDISYEKATEGSLEMKQIFTSIVPDLFGSIDGKSFKERNFTYHLEGSAYYNYWETAYYFGIAALLLGFIGLLHRYKTKEGILFIIVIVFSLLYSFGKNFFLFELFYKLPLFEYFRMPARMMFYLVLVFSVLAGFGFDALWNHPKDSKTLKKLIIITIIPLFIAILTATGAISGMLDTPEQFEGIVKNAGLVALAFIVAIFIVSAMINQQILKPGIGGGALILITILDLFVAGSPFNRNPDNPEKAYSINSETKKLFTAKPPKDLFRVSIRLYQDGIIAMTRNQGMIDKIMTTDGYNPLVLKRGTAPAPRLKTVHDFNNVRYAILKDSIKKDYRFFEYGPYFPRVWAVHKAIVMNSDEVFHEMKTKEHDYKNEVILEETPAFTLSGTKTDSIPERVQCIRYENNNFEYKVSLKEPSIVFFSEIWYPAWKAYIDGKPAKVYRANYCFRALAVPAGNHNIEMKYESDTFFAGMYISAITLILSIITLIICLIAEKKKEKES
ncbi:MAG: YfhO family protein [Ignavibacteriae bacterium]|nr:YfhO family protein [Ignavibacteriota bacterium]